MMIPGAVLRNEVFDNTVRQNAEVKCYQFDTWKLVFPYDVELPIATDTEYEFNMHLLIDGSMRKYGLTLEDSNIVLTIPSTETSIAVGEYPYSIAAVDQSTPPNIITLYTGKIKVLKNEAFTSTTIIKRVDL